MQAIRRWWHDLGQVRYPAAERLVITADGGGIDLISATTKRTGLTVHCELDASHYPKGIVVSDEQMASLNITRHDFHGEWNYTIHPRNNSDRAVIP